MILTGVVFTAVEYVSVIALIAVFFFISIMFPTIFAMGTKNLGTRKKLGGSYMIMAIVGGAIMPYFMGLIADYTHTAAAFLLPLCCFVCVVLYGAAYGRAGEGITGRRGLPLPGFQGFRLMGSCPFSRTRRAVPCMGDCAGRSLPISRKLWKHPLRATVRSKE